MYSVFIGKNNSMSVKMGGRLIIAQHQSVLTPHIMTIRFSFCQFFVLICLHAPKLHSLVVDVVPSESDKFSLITVGRVCPLRIKSREPVTIFWCSHWPSIVSQPYMPYHLTHPYRNAITITIILIIIITAVVICIENIIVVVGRYPEGICVRKTTV